VGYIELPTSHKKHLTGESEANEGALWAAGFRQDVGEVFAKSDEISLSPTSGGNLHRGDIFDLPKVLGIGQGVDFSSKMSETLQGGQSKHGFTHRA
jgi:hypothetical protein